MGKCEIHLEVSELKSIRWRPPEMTVFGTALKLIKHNHHMWLMNSAFKNGKYCHRSDNNAAAVRALQKLLDQNSEGPTLFELTIKRWSDLTEELFLLPTCFPDSRSSRTGRSVCNELSDCNSSKQWRYIHFLLYACASTTKS